MNKKNTKSKQKGKAEKLLLVAILALGVLGLTFSYGGKHAEGTTTASTGSDSTSSDGKVKSDRMILNLNERSKNSEKEKEVARF